MKNLIIIFLTFSNLFFAESYITVSGANVKKAKVALGQVHPTGEGQDANLARNIFDQFQSDLDFANIFEFLPSSLFSNFDLPKDVDQANYQGFSSTGAAFALKFGYKVTGGKLFLQASLYDVPGQKRILYKSYQNPANQYARIVHAVVEDILKELTGERGLFFSRIVMVCADYKKRMPSKEIYVSDPDGRNLVRLTSDNTISSRPSWFSDGRNISYTQHEWVVLNGQKKKGTVLKKHNLETGGRIVLSAREGMNSGATWSGKNARGVATLSFTGRPELYYIGQNSITDPEAISREVRWKRISGEGFQPNMESQLFDVEPSYNPDGNKIVFSSARSGHPMIYVLDLPTKVATQLTFAGQYNSSPTWSPKGDKILFAAQQSGAGNFDIYMIDPDGNNLSRITAGDKGKKSNFENPSFAPTGRHFAFASNESGHYAIYVMTIDGTQKTRISPSDKECQTPSWGPNDG